jgi:hypothetical protein
MGPLSPAQAAHRKPPRVVFKSPDAWQRGVLGTHCWTFIDRGEDEGLGYCADATHDFPEAEPAGAGDAALFRLWAPKRPSQLAIEYWREVDQDGQPVGNSQTIEAELQPYRKNGELVAFDAMFELPQGNGDHYLGLFAKWERFRRPHGRAEGDASYDFHLDLMN